MEKILKFCKKHIKQFILIILALASVVCLFLNCAQLEQQIYDDLIGIELLRGINIFFGLRYTTVDKFLGEEIKTVHISLYPSVCGIIALVLLLIAVVLYFFEDNKKLKKYNAYIVSALLLASAILYLLGFLFPGFTQDYQKEEYSILIYAVVGTIILVLACLYVLANKLSSKLVDLYKKVFKK